MSGLGGWVERGLAGAVPPRQPGVRIRVNKDLQVEEAPHLGLQRRDGHRSQGTLVSLN